ncbi:DUF1993 family protein [Glaciecola sp. 1036]|uniref:DUF1993 family protein n=1 Tax=Alteromonadaceae TaxID=72275 RepID=UPI003D0364D1
MNNKHISVFTHSLHQLLQIICKIDLAVEGNEDILFKRLAEDMLPLIVQAEIAASFALRACCPIAGVKTSTFVKQEKNFQGIKLQLAQTIEYIESLDNSKNDFSVTILDRAGPIPVELKADDFLLEFAYPNFYFHISIVYAIARANNVPLTKGDFDGKHQYPEGFSFEAQ